MTLYRDVNYKNHLFLPSYADRAAAEDSLSSRRIKAKVYQSSSLPTIYLQTKSGSETYIHKRKRNTSTGAMLLMSETGENLWMGSLDQIKIRGNSSASYSKKPYQIKLSEKANLLDMGKARTWILLANVIDSSLVRNDLAFRMAAAAGLPYTSKFRNVDVYLNGDYKGVYMLIEKIQIGKNRVPIVDLEKETEEINPEPLESYRYVYGTSKNLGTDHETVKVQASTKQVAQMPKDSQKKPGYWSARLLPNNPEDITGGYILESGGLDNKTITAQFVCDSGWTLVLKTPEEASQEEVLYIFGVFQQIDRAMTAGDWNELSRLIDVDSWVKKYVLEELLANYDGGAFSQYFYKDSDRIDGKVYYGPLWDMDNILGLNKLTNRPDVLYMQSGKTANVHHDYDIFFRLTKIPEFMALVKAEYKHVFRPLAAELLGEAPSVHIPSIADEVASLSQARTLNFVRWRPNHQLRLTVIGDSEEEHLAYLTNFLTKRVAFLDSLWLD